MREMRLRNILWVCILSVAGLTLPICLAQATGGGAGSVMVNLDLGEALASFDAYEPGDVVISNDPYTSGAMASHLPDVNMFKPVFVEGELIGFAWAYGRCRHI